MTLDLATSLAIGAPEIILAAGALVLVVLGVLRGDRSLAGITWGAVIVIALAAATVLDDGPDRLLAWNGLYVADGFSAFLKILVFIGSAASMLLALPYLRRTRTARFEYPILILLATLGMAVMVSANSLLTLYIGLELMSLAAYVLAAFHRNEARSSEAGLKYFVLGALSSGVLLYGVSLIYGFSGSSDFAIIAQTLAAEHPHRIGALFGLVFVLAGLAFKIGAVPFHMWLPDVYEGAPTPVAAFFAGAPKVAAMGLLLRVAMDAFGGLVADWRQVVIFMAIASMLLGAVGAIGQANIKRLLAYSSINNVGFALIGLAAATPAGITAVLFYMAVYLVMTIGSFLCLLALRDGQGRAIETLDGLAGLVRSRPGVAVALAIFMLSLAGLPPMFGFMPKLAVFNAAVASNLWPLAVIGVLASVIGAYYYLRVLKVMFFDAATAPVMAGGSRLNGAMLAAAALVCSPLGYLLLGPLGTATRRAAESLF
jgi:NADH-quinone oxidoreductase subunit N